MTKPIHLILFLFLAWSFASSNARAAHDLDFGLGGIASGRAGAVTAETENAFAARSNPALIPARATPLFGFNISTANARFDPLPHVLVDSRHFHTEAAVTRSGDYTLPPSALTTWAAGLSYPFRPRFLSGRRLGAGIALSGPLGRLASLSARSPYDFTSLRYAPGDSLFKGTVSLAVEVLPTRLYFGGGVNLFMSTNGNSDALLATDNPTGRMAMDVGLQSAIVSGAHGRIGDTFASLVYHQGIHPTFIQSFNGRMSWNGTEVFQQPMQVRATLCDEPGRVGADVQRSFGLLKASLGLSYQRWSEYRPSFLMVEAPDASGVRRITQHDAPRLRDTWNPRVSLETPLVSSRLTFSAGYEYRPTPVEDLSGSSNVLDTNAQVVGLSLRHRLDTTAWLGTPIVWGIYGQYHWLARRQVAKVSGDFVGAPGYSVSGRAYTYGLTVQAEL